MLFDILLEWIIPYTEHCLALLEKVDHTHLHSCVSIQSPTQSTCIVWHNNAVHSTNPLYTFRRLWFIVIYQKSGRSKSPIIWSGGME